jgi:hypothetical protein
MEKTTEIYIDSKCDFFNNMIFEKLPVYVIKENVKTDDDFFIESLKKSDPEKNIILLQGQMISSMEKEKIIEFIDSLICDVDFDVFYLSRYLDDNTRIKNTNIEINNMALIQTFSPHGIDALVISSKGKDKIKKILKLNDGRGIDYSLNNYCEKMICYTTIKPLISMNVSKENIKNNLYRNTIEKYSKPQLVGEKSDLFDVVWFIYFIILIICLSFIGTDYEFNDKGQIQKINYKNF